MANSPNANHVITGLTPQTQAPYARDALAIILKECPNITGVTFRIHGESGVPEGSYDLWRTIFDGCVRSGRPVELDMHAKGMDQPTMDVALATGLPVTISPKFSAEHHGPAVSPGSHPPTGDADAGAWRGRVCTEQRRAQLPALRLRRSADGGPPLRNFPPHLARHATRAVVGRPGVCGGIQPRGKFLRQRGSGDF